MKCCYCAGFLAAWLLVFSLIFIGSGLKVIQHMRKSPLINQLFEDLRDILTHPGLMRAFSISFLIWMMLTFISLHLLHFGALTNSAGIHDSLALVVLTTFTLGVQTPRTIGLFEAAATYFL